MLFLQLYDQVIMQNQIKKLACYGNLGHTMQAKICL